MDRATKYNNRRILKNLWLLALQASTIIFTGCFDTQSSNPYQEKSQKNIDDSAVLNTENVNEAATSSIGFEICKYDRELVDTTLKQGNVAVIVIHGEVSVLKPEVAAKILSDVSCKLKIFSVAWKWSDPKHNNPFFEQFGGVHKDGIVLLQFPDNSEQFFSIEQIDKMKKAVARRSQNEIERGAIDLIK